MKYAAIAIVLIVILIGAFVVFRGRTRTQIDEASPLIEEISQETQEISSLWTNVDSNAQSLRMVDTTYDMSIMTQEVDYCQTAKSTVTDMKDDLDSIITHENKVAESLQDLSAMKLPDWTTEYIDIRGTMADKDLQRVDKAKQMSNNLDTYYGFAEELLLGLIAEYNMETALKDGMDLSQAQDYVGAREQFQSALDYNSEVKSHVVAASDIFSFDYLDKIESNRESAESVIQKFIQVCDLADEGSYDDARALYEEADAEYRSISRVYQSDIKPENQSWWKENIESLSNDIKGLTNEIEDLQAQANDLIEEHKPS